MIISGTEPFSEALSPFFLFLVYESLRDSDIRFGPARKKVASGGAPVVVRASPEKRGRRDESESTPVALARYRK